MEKVIRDGAVAVILTKEHGAGWYSWHNIAELLYDPVIVDLVEKEKFAEVAEYTSKKYPDIYLGGYKHLRVVWLLEGTEFRIEEYDGYEDIMLKSNSKWLIA
jgi:hypothetical protein